MAYLTSFRYKDVELNDGLIYAVPTEGQNFDDLNVADESFMYIPGGDLPISTGITVKEGVLVLNIHIIAATPSQFEDRLNLLKQIFDTKDPVHYKLERKLSFQQSYSYLMVAARQMAVDRQQRKVSVTLTCIDRAWKGDTLYNASIDAFLGAPRVEHISVTYAGKAPYEPIIEVTALTAGSDGPVPLYFVTTDVYVSGPQHILNTPIQVASNWNQTALISAGKMRADTLDISVSLPNGVKLDRLCYGSAAARSVWVKPTSWPSLPATVRLPGGSWLDGVDASATTIPIFAKTGTLDGMPTSGKVAIDNEIIAYTGLAITSADRTYGQLTGCSRGQDGTAAQSFVDADYWWVKFPTRLTIGFGYSAAYAGTYFSNSLDRWPLLNYDVCTNSLWAQTTTNSSPFDVGENGYFTGRPLSWRGYIWLPERPGERVHWNVSAGLGSGTAKMQLYGAHYTQSFTSYRDRLVMQLLPLTSRKVTSARVLFTMWAGNTGQFPTTKAVLSVTREHFSNGYEILGPGQYSTRERYVDLYTATQEAGSAQKDSGYVNVSQDWLGATHLHLRVPEAPTNSAENSLVRIDEVWLSMDQAFREQPVAKLDTTLHGYGVDTFPVVLTIQNATDTSGPAAFGIWPMMDENQVATYDCDTYAVTGVPLASCTYDHPTWLRLLPGVNDIVVTGVVGIGHTRVNIKWKINS